MLIDYSKVQSTSAEPEASSMIETFRAIGYSLETAVADIIDNSISAKAKHIWIECNWEGPETILSIQDDGVGMNDHEIVQAMRPGSINPMEQREITDLGRFGLGLKTASFSQCRKFAVLSKKETTEVSYWCWDLDYVNQVKSWRLIKYCPETIHFGNLIEEKGNGTTILWWDLDRITKGTSKDSEIAKGKFLAAMDKVKKHLSMVFHRFLEEGISIIFNGRELKPWDPFMIGAKGLQPRPETILEDGRIRIKGFVLPHRSNLSPEEYNEGKGPEDSWTAHQGFYVYRNKRLLVAGDWLGFFKKESHYDLCRIKIDLASSMDIEWQTDIKKSVVRPPNKLKDIIASVAKDVRAQAVEVYRHRGKIISRGILKDDYQPLWNEMVRHGKRFYRLNREHSLLKELFYKAEKLTPEIERFLQFAEETVPVPLITLQESESEKPHGTT